MHTAALTDSKRRAQDTAIRDWLLDGLTVASGAVDAISFLALGKVFTAFMTGNIAFLGLRLAGDMSAPTLRSVLSSMGGFALGVFIATRIVTPSKSSAGSGEHESHCIWPRRTTVALALSLVPHAAFQLEWLGCGGKPTEIALYGLLATWAVAMGMQSAAVRRLDVGGVFTTAATATFIFLVGDFANRPVTHETRRRLAGVLGSLVVGATVGGLLLLHAPLYAPVLPLVLVAGVVCIATVRTRQRARMAASTGETVQPS